MIATSQTYKDYIAESSVLSFEIRFKINGSANTYSIYPEDCKDGSFKLVDELCPPGEFSVGNTIATYFEVELIDGLNTSQNLDLTGVKLFFGIPDANGHPTEAYQRGEYSIEKKFIYGKMMKLVGYDHFADANYNSANINNFNIGSYGSWQALVQGLGFTLTSSWNPPSPDNGNASLPTIKANAEYGLENITKRDLAGYVAEGFCCNLKFDYQGKLKRVFFPGIINTNADESLVGTAIVGTATVGDDYAIDSRMVRPKKIIDPPEIYGETISCDAIAVKALDGSVEEDAFIYIDPPPSSGSFNYFISDNPLIRDDTMATHIVNQGLDGLGGAFYAPFTLNIMGDPSWESGDIVRIPMDDGSVVYSVITSFQYNLGGISVLACQVEDVPGYSSIDQLEVGTVDKNIVTKGETLTAMPFVGYGYISTSQTTLRIMIPFCKPISAPNFTVTSIDNCYLRCYSSYVYYNDGSARTAISGITLPYDSISATIYPQQGIMISAVCDNKWYRTTSAAISNNSVVVMNGTITGTFS